MAINSSVALNRPEALYQGGKRQSDKNSVPPIITVVAVVKNEREDLLITLSSILSQDMENFEVLVMDGASDDGTLLSLRALDSTLDYWESCVYKKPYHAMNRAASLARGQWILFMNAGDYFCATSSLRQLFGNPPIDADFIVGHHIYFSAKGVEEVHRVRSFENTWSELRQGSLQRGWLTGIPFYQATLMRTELLKEYPFDTSYKIVADQDFMYRMHEKGKKFFVSPVISSYYSGGKLSWKNQAKCIEESINTCKKHSENPAAIERFFEPMLVSSILASLEMKNFGVWFKYLWKYPSLIARQLANNIFHNIVKKFILVNPSELYLDFRQVNNKEFQAVIDGFSSEPWGCWTDGKFATIKFDRPFEGKVDLTLECVHVFPPTLQSGAFIR
ncbi:MAG TPA: glycosyltransferase, partial [Methylococcales bacterium]